MFPPSQTSQPPVAPEALPSPDEHFPQIGPNLAVDDPEFCKEVLSYISTEFFYPYLLQAERMYPAWDRSDDMWRAQMNRANLSVPVDDLKPKGSESLAKTGKQAGYINRNNPRVARVSPAAGHKQMDAITNLGVAISFEDGQIPVQARKPKTVFEHPLYNPTEQSVLAANEELNRQATEIDLKINYRIGLGSYTKYGHAFALCDFERELEPFEELRTLPSDMAQFQMALFELRQEFGRPEDEVRQDQQGRVQAVWKTRIPKVMHTRFMPLDCSAVFIDELLPCRPMDRQPCPTFRTHVSRFDLEQNEYDPENNPFGWANIKLAKSENESHFALSQTDEQDLRTRIYKRWGMTDSQGNTKPKNAIKQLWTSYAMLGVDESGGKRRLDKGEGLLCLNCNGSHKVQVYSDEMGTVEDVCPHCDESGKIFVKAKRYVVQAYGALYGGVSATCLRIQRNPTAKDRVPMAYSSHLVEDTATARPVSKAEIAQSAYEQLATSHNQFLDAKTLTIRRPWKKQLGTPCYDVDCNAPDATIPWEMRPDEAVREPANTYDETATLIPYQQQQEKEIQDIFGANETVVGEISSGRRPSSEIQLANTSSMRPLINQIDQFNHDMFGQNGWGGFALDNMQAWADRDWFLKRTGREVWGNIELFTSIGDEMLKKQGLIASGRYVLELAGSNPALQSLISPILTKLLPAMGLDIDPGVIDQGMRKASMDAMKIVANILGDGIPLVPNQTDPHEIYCTVFSECLNDTKFAIQTGDKSNHWARYPQNLPMLEQRLMMQQQLLAQQQAMQMQMQMQQAAMQSQAENAGRPDPRGDQPKRPGKPAKSPGEQTQQNQG